MVFQSLPTARLKHGAVLTTVTGCATQAGVSSPPPSSCTTTNGNSGERPATDRSQLFLGFRIPTRATAPRSFTATTGPTAGGPTLHFTASKAYAAELQRLDKAPSGQVWVGYISQYFPYDTASGQQNFTAKVAFALSKKPSMRTFRYKVVIGGRQVTSGEASRKEPIDCENSLTTGYGGQGTSVNWVCVDDSFSSSLKVK